jgi:hypothetical protein
MRIRILERGATSIEEAFSIAARYESHLAESAGLMSSEEGGRRRVRAVEQQSDAASVDDAWRSQMEKSIADLRDGVAQLLQRQPLSASSAVAQSAPPSDNFGRTASGQQQPSSGRSSRPRGLCFKCGEADHPPGSPMSCDRDETWHFRY